MSSKLVPFGKYCLSSPLVFSLPPHRHGLCGSQKYTRTLASMVEACVLRHLAPLISGERAPQRSRPLGDSARESVASAHSLSAVGKVQQHDEPRLAFH